MVSFHLQHLRYLANPLPQPFVTSRRTKQAYQNLVIRIIIVFTLSEKFLHNTLTLLHSEVEITKPEYLIESCCHINRYNVKQETKRY